MSRLLIALCVLVASLACAAEKRIIVNAGDIEPMSYLAEHRPAGIAVDILKLVSDDAYRFEIRILPWKRAQLLTLESRTDAIVPLSRNAERENQYVWIAELFSESLIVVTAGKPAPQTLAQARQLRIGTLRGNPVEPSLAGMGFSRVEAATTEAQNARKLLLGRIDGWLVSDVAAAAAYRAVGGDPATLSYGVRVGDPLPVYLAAGADFPAADAQALHARIVRLHKRGAVAAVLRRYR